MTSFVRGFAVALLIIAGNVEAADWQYSVGVHDFAVPDVGSDTYGLDGSIVVDDRTPGRPHLVGSIDLFVDHDQDHLDSDHIPIWWQIHAGTDGDFWRADHWHLGWTADVNTRMNTVSSIERQITAFPALLGSYDGDSLQTSLQGGAGWFFLEIDDDAAREQGYEREELRNSTFGYAATADFTLKLGESYSISGFARRWWDNQEALETQYKAAIRMALGHWVEGRSSRHSALVLSADYYEYNLSVYNHPTGPPVLRWNDDLMIRLSFVTDW